MMLKNKSSIFGPLVAGFIFGILFALATVGGTKINMDKDYSNTIIILSDEKCDICSAPFNKFVNALEGNVGTDFVKIVKLTPYRGEGAKIYEKLREENVNVVPLILLTKDLAGSKVFEYLDKVFSNLGGINTNIIELKDYYAIRPIWPTRRYVPGVPEKTVEILADKNVDVNSLKSIVYLAADNVVTVEKNAEGNYFIHVDGPPAVIYALAQYLPLSTHTSTSLEVPYINVIVQTIPEVAEEINAILSQPNIRILELNIIQGTAPMVASIMTDHPEIIAKLFPGAKVLPSGVVIDRDSQIFLDVYLGGPEDNAIISELSELAASAPDRVLINPHYIVIPTNKGIASFLGPDGVDRSVIEYCVFINYGAWNWLKFTDISRNECKTIANCWENVAADMGLDTQKISNCYASKNNVIKFFLNDTVARRITRQFVLVNSWYVWVPGKQSLTDLACKFLVFPPESLCGGE